MCVCVYVHHAAESWVLAAAAASARARSIWWTDAPVPERALSALTTSDVENVPWPPQFAKSRFLSLILFNTFVSFYLDTR